jgi:hypothetical protein
MLLAAQPIRLGFFGWVPEPSQKSDIIRKYFNNKLLIWSDPFAKLMNKNSQPWQDTDPIFALFSDKISAARKKYKAFVAKGVNEGKRADLTGGGLIRSSGGWAVVKEFRIFLKTFTQTLPALYTAFKSRCYGFDYRSSPKTRKEGAV